MSNPELYAKPTSKDVFGPGDDHMDTGQVAEYSELLLTFRHNLGQPVRTKSSVYRLIVGEF